MSEIERKEKIIKHHQLIENLKSIAKTIPIKTILLVLLLVIPMGSFLFYVGQLDFVVHINPGERGVLFNRFGGGISEVILEEGTHFIVPGFQSVFRTKISRQNAHIERITADSMEFQDVALWLNIEFQIREDSITQLYRDFGIISSQSIIDRFIIPNTNEVTKNIMIGYPIGDILVSQPQIKAEITQRLQQVLEEYHISIIDVDIENIRLDPAFREIIAEIEFSVYQNQREDLQLEIASKTAEQRLLEAETLKQELILQAQGELEYNLLINEISFDNNMLEYKRLDNQRAAIEQWNGTFPETMGDVQQWPF